MKFKKSRKNCCPCCNGCPCQCERADEQGQKTDAEAVIYNILNTAERISVKLAQINQILKKAKKKKVKKLGKVDKKTGTLILKGQKKAKKAKAMGRYKAAKKKKKK